MTRVQVRIGSDATELGGALSRALIGRSPQCELHVEHPSVSRRHAEVYVEGGQTLLRDLGSSNGTWVDGGAVGTAPVALRPGQQIFIGQVPLVVAWDAAAADDGGRTMMGGIPPEVIAAMTAHRAAQQVAAQRPIVEAPLAAVGASIVAPPAGSQGPDAASFPYRCQGANGNGVLLIALRKDTFSNGEVCDGYLEFTAMDDEVVSTITIELVECHEDGPSKGHVWDRMLVRQGPWRAQKGDTVPMPFSLRVPPGTSISGRRVHWELRGYVDIAWASDIEAKAPITMRNTDIERLRDALGALDFRVNQLESAPLGQRFKGKFQPPANLVSQIGLTDVNMVVDYLGTNLKVSLEVEKSSWFKFDKKTEVLFDLGRLRAASVAEVAQHFKGTIDTLMAK